MKFFIYSVILSISVASFFTACNPAKKLNQAVVEHKEEGVKVQFPTQGIATPDNINMVYDYEDIYTPQEEKKLDSMLRTFEKSNLIPIKLVTLKASNLQTSDFDANNALLYKEWDQVHGKSGKSMVVAISTEMKKSKNDYGPFVAKFISEADIAAIVEKNLPLMQRGENFNATWEGLNEMMDIIRNNVGKGLSK